VVVESRPLNRLVLPDAVFQRRRPHREDRVVDLDREGQRRVRQHRQAIESGRRAFQRHGRRGVELHSDVERPPAADAGFVLEPQGVHAADVRAE
jgi:hypothetical protein